MVKVSKNERKNGQKSCLKMAEKINWKNCQKGGVKSGQKIIEKIGLRNGWKT